MASRLWQAVTPEPQYITAWDGSRPSSSCREVVAQHISAAETSSRPRVRLVVMIDRTGNMSGHAIDRLGSTFVSLGRAGVHEQRRRVVQVRDDLVHADSHPGSRRGDEGRGSPVLEPAACGPSLAQPLRPSAVEQRDGVMSRVSEQPPQAARIHARVLIVDNDLSAGARCRVVPAWRASASIDGNGCRPFEPVFGPAMSWFRLA